MHVNRNIILYVAESETQANLSYFHHSVFSFPLFNQKKKKKTREQERERKRNERREEYQQQQQQQK